MVVKRKLDVDEDIIAPIKRFSVTDKAKSAISVKNTTKVKSSPKPKTAATSIKKPTKAKKSAAVENWKEYIQNTPTLDEIAAMVKDVSSTTSSNEKTNLLAKHAPCCKAMLYCLHPYWLYHVTSSNLEKHASSIEIRNQGIVVKDVFDLLDALRTRISGHVAIGTVLKFISSHRKHADLIKSMIDKDLKIRCGTATINKVFPGMVPVFSVSLANAYNEKTSKKVHFESGKWFSSRKMDGVRVLTFIDNEGNIEFTSREGNPFTTLKILATSLKEYGLTNRVLDGELCVVTDGLENFKKTISAIKKKDSYVKHPRYYVFDTMTTEEFMSGKTETSLCKRYSNLVSLLSRPCKWDTVHVLDQITVKDQQHLSELVNEADEKGWEGLMLRKNVPYEGKRTNHMLKVKKFEKEEYVVTGYQTGEMRVVNDGEERMINTLTAVTINHKDKSVSVGSGFSLDERRRFFDDPELIVGKTISVQYYEETEDGSLRFPTFLALYGDTRDI